MKPDLFLRAINQLMKQLKCPYCATWNEGEDDICSNCGKDMFEREKHDLAKRHAAETNYMRMVPIHEDDGILQRLWKHPVRLHGGPMQWPSLLSRLNLNK